MKVICTLGAMTLFVYMLSVNFTVAGFISSLSLFLFLMILIAINANSNL